MPSCQHSGLGWCPLEGMANRPLEISFLSGSHSDLAGVYLACLEVLVHPQPPIPSVTPRYKLLKHYLIPFLPSKASMVLNGELGGQDQNHSSWKSGFHSCASCLESSCLMQTRKDRPAETLIPVTNVTRHIICLSTNCICPIPYSIILDSGHCF